jgi:hypothetical protein
LVRRDGSVRIAIVGALSLWALLALAGPAGANHKLNEPVPAEMIVTKDGLEWVWASPCALNGCTTGISVGKDGFNYATQAQWAQRPAIADFGVPKTSPTSEGKCAAPWFDASFEHCDGTDPYDRELSSEGAYGSAPLQGMPAGDSGNQPMEGFFETWLVRVASPPATEGPVGDPSCSDGVDNDGDGQTDAADEGCQAGSDLCFGLQATIAGNGTVTGTNGDDVIITGNGDDTVDGKGGNDRICTRGGDDHVRGGTGNDRINSGNGTDNTGGHAGDDIVQSTGGDDDVQGGDGMDRVQGGEGNDTLNGGDGSDSVQGQGDNDLLAGNAGAPDYCDGGTGTDQATANSGCEVTANVP